MDYTWRELYQKKDFCASITLMRFLGIDYGAKRIGLAISDERQTLAFPKEILPNDKNIFEKIAEILREENITEVVIGESLDFSGKPNKISGATENFITEFEEKFKLPVHKQKEFLTTVEARRYQENNNSVDASAAALILQRYLDKKNKKDTI